ncbi:MAG TPA: PKD domain-containing protein [Myxococcales bacterium]|nr:PKD domain-containing protein [Myxococcales bacterium]
MHRIVAEMRLPAVLSVLATALACSQGGPRAATVQGQVVGADGQPAAGVDARLAGTALFAVTDAGGRFSLSGAPSGPSVLQLGRGNASVALPPAARGMVLNLVVRLSANDTATLQGDPQVMLRGTIDSVDGSDFRIGDTTIHSDEDTAILDGPESGDIDEDMIGEVADVQGLLDKDGCIRARIIHARFHHDRKIKVEFTGIIQSIARRDHLVVDGKSVVVDSRTHITVAGKKASFSALKVGQTVHVRGELQRDRTVIAKFIDVQQVAPPPVPPVANAGPDQSVTSGAAVTLDGSASTDPAGLPLTFAWTQASGPAVTLAGAATARPTFTAPTVAFGNPPAVLVFSLVVSDANAVSAPDTVAITVNAIVPPPVANAGPDQRVASAALVTLDGTGSSDPAGLPLTFAWSQAAGPAVTLSNPAAAQPTFTAPSIAPGLPAATLTFTLVVSDANASSAPSSVTITVDPLPPPPQAPIANAGPNQTVDSGALVTLDGSASSDPAGLPISFAWSQVSGPAVTLLGANTVNPSFTAPTIPAGQTAGVLVFALVVTDANLSSAPSTVTITVNPLKPLPVANAGPNQTVASGALVTLDGSASSSALPLTFAWSQASGPAVTLTGSATANPTFTAPIVPFNSPPATLTFSLVVSDANGSSAPASVTITVNPQPPPPPVANAGPDQAVPSGAFVTLDGSGSTDPAGLPLSFAWTQTAGPIVTLSNPAVSNPTFTAPVVPFGSTQALLTFTLVVTDANFSSAPAQVNVTVSPELPPNPAPVANAGPDQAVASGAAVALDGSASADPDGEPITFAWSQTSGPAVALAGADTAHPTFTAPTVPAGSPAAVLVFALVVTDPHASSTPASVTITVNPEAANFPPPPGTPPPASPNPSPLPVGGNGSHRFEVGAALGLYLQDPAAGEPTVSGFVVVNLAAAGGGLPGNAPADTVVTLNGVALLRDPNLNGNFFRLDPAGPQPSIGWGGQMVLVATGTDPKDGKTIQRQLVMDCPRDIQVSSVPPIGSVITGTPSLHITSPSDITFNVGIPLMASIFPTVQLFGYDRASRTLAPSGAAINIAPGPLDVTVPVTPTAADAYLLDLRWPGVFVLDGQTGGFCGLAKRWSYAK